MFLQVFEDDHMKCNKNYFGRKKSVAEHGLEILLFLFSLLYE